MATSFSQSDQEAIMQQLVKINQKLDRIDKQFDTFIQKLVALKNPIGVTQL